MVQISSLPKYYEKPSKEKSSGTMHASKRAGTFGIRCQLYETKLLSLLCFRAIHDDIIQEFQVATNNDKIGAFDDICFKVKVKSHDKPITVFIQAQHKANKRQTLKIDLPIYFDSYKKIRKNFGQIFEGTFNETECLFVILTNANVDYCDAPTTSDLVTKLNDVLDTGGVVKQPNSEENIEYLTKKVVQDKITSLAKLVVRIIYNKVNFQFTLSYELVLRYHVILAQKVFEVSDIQPLQSNDAPQYRIASFRQDFFDNTEEYIMLFRETLYLEVIKRRKIEPAEIRLSLSEFLVDSTNAVRLSKLIGTVVTFNNGQLEFDKKSTKTFGPNMKPMNVSRSTVNKAVELAAREMLSAVKFKVPAAFGNMDLTLSGSDAKIEKRICYLALKVKDLLDKYESSKVVTIDEPLDAGFLQLNGGIAGAVGNIFVLDDNTNLMKITDNCETLGTRAKNMYTKLKSEVHNLHEYKFCFKIYKFPVLSFASSHYEEKMARDFLDKMLVYANQADETDLEDILKNEIADIQRNQPNYFQAKTDLILSRYYDEIRTWCKRAQDASYLTQRINLFRQLIDEIIKDPLMSSINKTFYTSKVKQHDYTFTEDAVRSLNLPDQLSGIIIVAGNCLLTVVKLLQHLKSKQVQHVVLDLQYITSLPTNDLNALRAELVNANKDKTLILVCDQLYSTDQKKIIKNIAEAVQNKTNIIITDQKSLEILTVHKYFPEADIILYDKKFCLNDVNPESQRSILESATVVFPGVEIGLQHLLRSWPKTGVTSAGETDKAAVVNVSDKLTAEICRPFGDDHQDAQKVARIGSSCKTYTQDYAVQELKRKSSRSSSSLEDEQTTGEADGSTIATRFARISRKLLSSAIRGQSHAVADAAGMQVLRLGAGDTGSQRYELNELALRHLLLHPDVRDLPAVVVSVAGAYRGGKSFILDFFLRYLNAPHSRQLSGEWLGKEDETLKGFHWRGGGERDTTGIHLWSEPVITTLDTGEKVAVLLMDTQGTFDLETTVGQNSAIFALSTLISSVQIYNLSGNIKDDDLQHLQLFTEYGRLVSDAEGKAFQTLLFLVRDWMLPFEHEYGFDGGAALLNKRLQSKPYQNAELREVREHINSSFDQIKCFLMPHPGLHVTKLNFAGCIGDLTEKFRSELLKLVPSLFDPEHLTPKLINGERVRAQDLFYYFQKYVDIFNSDDMPEAVTIFKATAEACLLAATRAALSVYEARMKERVSGGRSVLASTLHAAHAVARADAENCFVQKKKLGSQQDADMMLEELTRELNGRLSIFILINEKKVQETLSLARKTYDATVNSVCGDFANMCLQPQELNNLHAEACLAAFSLFDAARDVPEDEEDDQRKNLEKSLQQKYQYLSAVNDRNNKSAVLAARDAYVAKMRSEMNQGGISADKLQAQHEEARRNAEARLEEQRKRPSSHGKDSFVQQLLEEIECYFEEFEKTNKNNKKMFMQATELTYNNYIISAWGPQVSCFHPQALQELHQKGVKATLAECLADRDDDDEYKDDVLEMLKKRFNMLTILNNYNNEQAVEQAVMFYTMNISQIREPSGNIFTVFSTLMGIKERWKPSRNDHERCKWDAVNVFKKRRRGTEYPNDQHYNNLIRNIDAVYGKL